ncbi:MAG TPA: ATP-binding protein, partial [Bradyrhizobium sp.]|nr:ATP-binding protein [Bradyrhizobium sp.]
SMAVNNLTTVVAKGNQGQGEMVATSTRITASNVNDTWMRILMLAPSATTSMSVTMLGDADLTMMSAHFIKPQGVITMGFSDDPLAGLSCDHFSGAAITSLSTQSFVLRTAALR